MIGTLFKYAVVAVVGAVGFAATCHFNDGDVIEQIRLALEEHEATLSNELTVEQRKAAMSEFIAKHRSDWLHQFTFANNLKELDRLLVRWQ